jgi:beta-mannosidase
MQPNVTHDLRTLDWTVAGYLPSAWSAMSMELGFPLEPEVASVPARVPGSVQGALREAGVLPDWYVGLNSRACEWVEHREWVYTAQLPDAWFAEGARVVLNCAGLDGNGIIVCNTRQVGAFDNAFIPYQFDLTAAAQPMGNVLHLIFCTPPKWLGQIGYTSRMTEWKPRFNYTWDWVPRLVQIGPWAPVTLAVTDGAEISALRCRTAWDVAGETGTLWMTGELVAPEDCRVRVTLAAGETVVRTAEIRPAELAAGLAWDGLGVAPWWPNGAGERALYAVTCELLDAGGAVLDRQTRTVGFKHVAWAPCAGAPAGADPWVCVINGRPLFLQGINWTPIRPTFADLTQEDYRRLIAQYAELGINIIRVWGGGFPEHDWLYELCDAHGILIWQEFPLSSAGHENWPPEDDASIGTLEAIAASYIARRQHHASLLMWCGGNELQGDLQGTKFGTGLPVTLDHPLMRRWAALVEREDPGRRFMPTSSSGPRFFARAEDFGQGLHWDVHGPWSPPGATPAEWAAYWHADDALFRSETGAPGASDAALIRRHAGEMPVTPGTMANPLWRRFCWWIEWEAFAREQGREPESLEEYVAWSQARQAEALTLAISASKARFPGIGGIILWMGHDAFPCTANTATIDFDGTPKPAALAASRVWKMAVEELASTPSPR